MKSVRDLILRRSVATEPTPAEPAGRKALLECVDALSALLVDFGAYAFDVENCSALQKQTRLTQWKDHLLKGGASPGGREARNPLDFSQRDWQGLRRDFSALRKDERDSVLTVRRELRAALWATVTCVAESSCLSKACAARVDGELATIRKDLASASGETLRTCAQEIAKVVGECLTELREQQKKQSAALVKEVDILAREFHALKEMAGLDPITGVGNRAAFEEEFDKASAYCEITNVRVTLAFCQVCGLKTWEREVPGANSDALLASLGRLLLGLFPRKGDFIASHKRDTFALILTGETLASARGLMAKLQRSVREEWAAADTTGLRFAVGVAERRDGERPLGWQKRTDDALARAVAASESCTMES